MNTSTRHLLLLPLAIAISLFWTAELSATHLIGGSLNYEYLGQNNDGTYRYRIYSLTFTDCGPESNFPDPEALIPVAIYENDSDNPDADKQLITEFNLPRVSFEEVVLEGLSGGCEVGADICVEQALYELEVDLPLNFDGYWIYYDRCCRNNGVVNLTELQGVGMSTFIPSPLIENSSPFFNAPPTPFLCAGDTTTFLNSAIDPDGDLLVFSFINPYRGYGTNVNPNPGQGGYQNTLGWEVPLATYAPGYSVNEPFGAGGYAFINGATGLTTYMAPAAGQYSVALEVKEYRNGVLIGIVRRDIQLTVINCPPNPAPELAEESQGNVGVTDWEIAEGDTLCFPVTFTDDSGDSLRLSSLGEVFDVTLVNPIATINTPQEGLGSVSADFCWETDCSQGRTVPYFFSVTASDNGCPPKSESEVYQILVIPFTGAQEMNGNATVCENSTETYTTDVATDAQYQWVVNGGSIASGQGSNEITVDWGSAGVGNITVIMTNFRDCVGDPLDIEVAIQPLPVIDAGIDISICLGDTVDIGGAPTGPGGSFFIWGPDSNIEATNVPNPEVFPTETMEYNVQVVSANSCSARDTILVTVNEAQLQVSPNTEICSGTSTQLQASGATSYAWTPEGSLDNSGIATPNASPNATTTYTVTSLDVNGCAAEEQVTIEVFEQPIAEAGPNQILCGLETMLAPMPSAGDGTWSVPVGITLSGPMPSQLASAANEGIYTLTWSESTGDGLCVSDDTVTLEFIEQPVASIVAEDSICGLEAVLDAGPVTGAGLWQASAGLNLDMLSTPSTNATADDYGSYQLIWTETNQICADADTVDIVFTAQPSMSLSMNDSICGDTYSLVATASDYQTATWSGGPAGLSFSNQGDLTTDVTSAAYGTQDIILSLQNESCLESNSLQITFLEIPNTDAGEDLNICGLSLDLEAQISTGTGAWLPLADISYDDENNPNTEVSSSTWGSYPLVWLEDSNGCIDSDTVLVSFLEVPVVTASADEGICLNSSLALTAAGADSYTWSPSEDLDNPEIANPVASPTETTTYTVTGTLGNGCDASEEVVITVFDLPIVDAGADISYLCNGDSIQLQATAGFANYAWTPISNLSSTSVHNPFAGPFAQVTTTSPITYSVVVTDDNNCQNDDSVTLTINPDVPTDAGLDTLVCAGEPVMLGANPTSPSGSSYTWSPDVNIDDTSSANPTVTPTETTTYVLETANSICTGTDAVTVIVEAGPELNYDITAIPSCEGLDIQFINTSPEELDYEWHFGDGNTSTDYSPAHLYAFNAQYEVLLWAQSVLGCLYPDTGLVDASDFASYFDLQTPNVITPNGDGENDVLDINVSGQIETCLSMQVFNRWGQVLFTASGNNTRWDGRSISGQLVEPGVYFYYVEFNGTSHKGSVQVLY